MKRKKRRWIGILLRFLLVIFMTVLFLTGGLYGVLWVVANGPSPSARDLFVVSVKETSAIGFLADWFIPESEVKDILASNSVVPKEEEADPSLITLPDATEQTIEQTNEAGEASQEKKDIELIPVSGSTYKGKMLIIQDPSRVFVGVSGEFGEGNEGKKVSEMADTYGCIAGTNAGGFNDPGGMGNGGTPEGIVISQGKLVWGELDKEYDIIGFDRDNRFIVGKMTGQEALDKGIRDAVCFGPVLMINGQPSEVNGTGGGLNPRTAIGQRADGAVLLLVIDGRQANSLGATYADIIYLMQKYGAVNAANLDGGTSSHMVYQGEVVTDCSSLYGPRDMPTAILVK